MTPFGAALRRLRAERGITQKAMAAALGVSPAYLSALEHGRRGQPNWEFVQRAIGYLNIIWDEAEELQTIASLSDPRVVIDTAGLSAEATLLANRLSAMIATLEGPAIERLNGLLDDLAADRDGRTSGGEALDATTGPARLTRRLRTQP